MNTVNTVNNCSKKQHSNNQITISEM